MSAIAFLRQLLDDGLDLAAAMIAADRFEQRQLGVIDARKAKDRERKKAPRNSVESAEPMESAEAPLPRPPSPQTPHPPTPTPPDITTRTRGSRSVPEGWAPSAETMRVLAAEGHDSGSIERALTMMRDHEFRTARTKWDATFRNWVREDAKRQPRKAHERPHLNQRASAYAERLVDIGAAMEAALEQRGGSG